MVRDLLELLVREPEAISIHQWPPDEVVHHESAARSNSFMGPGPSSTRSAAEHLLIYCQSGS
jgi:hypothetical protein